MIEPILLTQAGTGFILGMPIGYLLRKVSSVITSVVWIYIGSLFLLASLGFIYINVPALSKAIENFFIQAFSFIISNYGIGFTAGLVLGFLAPRHAQKREYKYVIEE
ncbi:MAG: hypothetical protein DRP01_00560 [Archaeoglobales archaeon]|nr:MAG: hypothetical protein DRP01_00560 [Archaeoglobales archaeon]